MSLTCFGKCSICTLSFELDDISTLKCGHTYHPECITTWIHTGRNCPKCRMKNTSRDIIRLFVDEPDKSTTLIGISNNDAEINRLLTQLNEMDNSKKAIELELNECEKTKQTLEIKLKKEKQNSNDQIKFKDQHIKNLEKMLGDQDSLKRDLDSAQRRLKASEFYALISSKKGSDEEKIGRKIDKYSTGTGDPHVGVFFKSILKQFKNLEKVNAQLNHGLSKERQDKNKLASDLDEAKQELDSRKRRVVSTQGASPASSTSFGRKQCTRVSLGFSFLTHDNSEFANNKENFDDSDIQIISQGPLPIPKTMVMNSSCLVLDDTSNFEAFNFDDYSMKPSMSNMTKPTKNQPYLGDDLNSIFSKNYKLHAKGDLE